MIQQFVSPQYGLHQSYPVMMQPGPLPQIPNFPVQQSQQQPSYPMSSPVRNFGFDPRLDEKLRYIDELCKDRKYKKQHGRISMQYIGDTKTDRGTPCAAYRCPVCGYMEFYVCDFQTNEARRHWFEPAK